MKTAQQIADELAGTCMTTIEECLDDDQKLTPELEEEVNALVIECDVCGWWHDLEELNEDGVCESCVDEIDGDGDEG